MSPSVDRHPFYSTAKPQNLDKGDIQNAAYSLSPSYHSISIRQNRLLQGNRVEKRVAEKGMTNQSHCSAGRGSTVCSSSCVQVKAQQPRTGGQLMSGGLCSSTGSLCNPCAEPQPRCLQHSSSLALPATQAANKTKQTNISFSFLPPNTLFSLSHNSRISILPQRCCY